MTTVTLMGMIFSSDNVPDFGSIRLTKKRYNNVNDYIFLSTDLSKLSLITNAAEGSTAIATDTGDLYILHMGIWSILGGESEESTTNAAQVQTLISPLNINREVLTNNDELNTQEITEDISVEPIAESLTEDTSGEETR